MAVTHRTLPRTQFPDITMVRGIGQEEETWVGSRAQFIVFMTNEAKAGRDGEWRITDTNVVGVDHEAHAQEIGRKDAEIRRLEQQVERHERELKKIIGSVFHNDYEDVRYPKGVTASDVLAASYTVRDFTRCEFDPAVKTACALLKVEMPTSFDDDDD